MMRWLSLNDDLAVMQYPLRAFGIDFGRNTTLLRLRDGRLLVHSSAPFTADDVAAMRRFGEPAWLVEATKMHDTFTGQGQAALPDVPYLTPARLHPPPADWSGQIDQLKIEGLRLIDEHAFFHRASRTLVLSDLLFHFPAETSGWARFFVRKIMRLPRLLGISFFFRQVIRDRVQLTDSLRTLLQWDFQQIVVAHRAPITKDARGVFRNALRERGLPVAD